MSRNLVQIIRRTVRPWLTPAALAILLTFTPAVRAQGGVFDGWFAESGFGGGGGCGECDTFCCQRHHCPPALSHCQEGAPKIRVKCGCPRPICNPCNQPNWGYYETCWSPWPWPPNYNHCWTMPPAATVALTGPDGRPNPYYQPPTQPPLRNVPPGSVPTMPSTPNLSLPMTPAPRLSPNPTNFPPGFQPGFQPPAPQPVPGGAGQPFQQPIPGGGIESLPVPRSENPRPLPPGGEY